MKKMLYSIRFRLACSVSVLLCGVFLLCWIANQAFLPMYYQHEKCSSLKKMYTAVSDKLNEGNKAEEEPKENTVENYLMQGDTHTSEVELAIEKLSEESNVSVYVVDWHWYFQNGEWIYRGNFIYPSENGEGINEKQQQFILDQMGHNYGFINGGMDMEDVVTLYKEKNGLYTIIKAKDNRLDSQYLELVGNITVGGQDYTIYMRTNYESIQESVAMSSRFLLYAALIAVFVGVLVMVAISDGFTKPIRELSDVAREMAELKFEYRYKDKRNDEIGDLGHSINVLSEQLENTISELKAANNELQSDIADKIQIDEMRKEFLSNVTHELKTPIALIQGYAEGLQENINDDEESREFYCEVIIDEANKMNKMVQKLLNLNQIEFGKNQIEYERFDLVPVIQSVLSSNMIMFEQKEVTLVFEQTEPVYVWADEYFVQEVISNYVSNALNHVDGERIIWITLQKSADTVRVAVRNTGEQIPEEDLEKVWIKFFKVDKARTREYGGSGIGLSIVKAIMNSMHRECGVFNQPDGVEFWFDLDVKDQ